MCGKFVIFAAESALYSFLVSFDNSVTLQLFLKGFDLQAKIGSSVGLGSHINILRVLYRWSSSYPASTSQDGIYFEKYNVSGIDLVVYKKLAWVPAEETDQESLRPCLIYLHGGGWVFTSPCKCSAFLT